MEKKNEKSLFLRWFHGLTGGDWGTDPGDFDPSFVRASVERLKVVFGPGRYFGVEASGWENLPEAPSLVVSNHSGGAAAPDVWGFLIAWHRHFNAERPIHPLAHEMVLSIAATGKPFSRLGVLRADPKMAESVLRDWRRDIFVMPGGEIDVFRPFSKRYEVQFAGRLGYARLAFRTGTPVVPVANAGAHSTLVVLTDGQMIAERLRLNRLLRLNVFPIHLSFPWGLAIGPWPHLPPPTKLRYKVGVPVVPPTLAQGEEPTPEMLQAFDREVQSRLQSLLRELEEESVPVRCRLKRRWTSGWTRAKALSRRVRDRLSEESNLPASLWPQALTSPGRKR